MADIKKEAGRSGDQVTKTLMNIQWAGAYNREELLQLEENLRYMLDSKQYGYKYIENYLYGLGFSLDLIRKAFMRITGVCPLQYINNDAFMNTPASMPRLNYGWGESKDKKYDYYFIMGWNNDASPSRFGYSIFGQKGDAIRDEVEPFITLNEARAAAKKMVKDLIFLDMPLDIDLDKLEEDYQTVDEPVITAAKKEKEHESEILVGNTVNVALDDKEATWGSISEYATVRELKGQKATVEFANGTTREVSLKDITKVAAELEPEEKNKVVDQMQEEVEDTKGKPYDELAKSESPQELFEDSLADQDAKMAETISKNIEKILDYVKNKASSFHAFKISIKDFKYNRKELEEKIKRTPEIAGKQVEEFFASTAIVPVVLEIEDVTLPTDINKKGGLIIFSIVDGNVTSSDNFKGEDNKLYALTETGLNEYFRQERMEHPSEQQKSLTVDEGEKLPAEEEGEEKIEEKEKGAPEVPPSPLEQETVKPLIT